MRSHAAGEHDAERGHREREQQQRSRAAEHLATVRWTPTSGASTISTMPWRPRRMPPPTALPNTSDARETGATSISRMKPNSRSHTIAIAENSADVMHRHREDAREDVLLVATPPGRRCADEVLQTGAEHEQEQQRLREPGDDPRRHAPQPDQLAPPDHPDRAHVARRRSSRRTVAASPAATGRCSCRHQRPPERARHARSPRTGRALRPRRRGCRGRCT